MKKAFKFSIIAIFLTSTTLATNLWANDYAAMVMDMQNGAATYAKGPMEGNHLEIMEFLYEADAVAIPAGVTLVLNYFESSKREKINGPATIMITRDQSKPLHAEKTLIASETVNYMPPKSDLETMQVQNFGTVAFRKVGPAAKQQKRAEIAILSLSNTAILSAEAAVLHWRAVTGATRYAIKLYDGSNKMIQEIETMESPATFDAQYLRSGNNYSWTLSAIKESAVVEEIGGRFWILSAGERNTLKEAQNNIEARFSGQSTEELLLLNLHFQRHKLRDDAAEVLMELHRLHPDNSMVVGQLKKLNPNLIK